MKIQPLVSICIPAYNSESFIKETIESVINQSYKNIEIIINDDFSKDKTVEIIYSFDDNRIKFFQNKQNLGAEGNWNKSLERAKGKYCKIMGADDILSSNCIEEQVAIFENPDNKNIVLVTSNKKVINQDGKLIINRKFPGKGRITGIKSLKKCLYMGTNLIGEPAAGLFRKEILEKSGYYNGENLYMIDLDLWSRILKFGDLYAIPKVLYSFRISTKSISTNIGFAQIKLFNTFVNKLYLDKSFQINYFDKIIAEIMSFIMGISRNLVYILYFKK
ncbi:MAG: glycosyltransferase [Bacteroidetes bacterium]|nr:glycosyltransferase [Bacteroidota bacterium]